MKCVKALDAYRYDGASQCLLCGGRYVGRRELVAATSALFLGRIGRASGRHCRSSIPLVVVQSHGRKSMGIEGGVDVDVDAKRKNSKLG